MLMRDPARIPKVLALLEQYWNRYPDLRLAQIVGNFSPFRDSYHLEDDALIDALEAALDADEMVAVVRKPR